MVRLLHLVSDVWVHFGTRRFIIKSMTKGHNDVRSHIGCFCSGCCDGFCDVVAMDTQSKSRSNRPFSTL